MDNLNFFVDNLKKSVDKSVDNLSTPCGYSVKKITCKKIFDTIFHYHIDKILKFKRFLLLNN